MKTSIKIYIGIIFTAFFLTSCKKENLEEIFNHQVNRDFYSTSEEVTNGEQIRKSHVKVRGYDHKDRSKKLSDNRPGDIVDMIGFGTR